MPMWGSSCDPYGDPYGDSHTNPVGMEIPLPRHPRYTEYARGPKYITAARNFKLSWPAGRYEEVSPQNSSTMCITPQNILISYRLRIDKAE